MIHFRRPSRRAFLQVGAAAALGLTLDGSSPNGRAAATPQRLCRTGRANRSSTSSCRAASPTGIWDPRPFAPIEYRGEMGNDQDQAQRRPVQRMPEGNGQGRRQNHGVPLDDARRGRPRARHAQHVHRLSAQPGTPLPEHGQRGLPRIRAAEQHAALRLHSEHADELRRQRLSFIGLRPVQPGRRPGQRRLQRAGPQPARRHHDKRFTVAGTCSTRSTTISPPREKADGLEAMDTFYQRA